MKQIAGKATVYIDGKKKWIGDSYSYALGNATREDSIGKSGVAGYTETPAAAKISMQLIDTEDSPLEGIESVTDATIVLDLNDGTRQYTYFNCAYIGDPLEIDQDGRATVEFHSPSAARRTK